ncbi:GLPGLI family protein [Roseivirga misakiensis]|uniref:GLPGLI family protein n=1 Tax=Roseivirga misakiensis TaxID=1563681 RepID=A0A1E5T6I6_9BACT|nr:GLPGLI family protein [Roseivirga misakiensis]OEK07004.1 hypothetical protein BFP71_04920 [Roseivirga misakiensis]
MKSTLFKSILLLGLLVLGVSASFGQQIQGIATYNTVRDYGKAGVKTDGMSEEMKQQIAAMMKARAQKTFILYFNGEEANWIDSKNPDEKRKYRDLAKGLFIEESAILNSNYLVKGELSSGEWQLSDETKQIGPYLAKKATAIRTWQRVVKKGQQSEIVSDAREVVAWYTEEIPIKHGPDHYWGLPGLVLTLDDGKMKYECVTVNIEPEEAVKITIPTIGKKVSREEYKKIQEEQRDLFLKGFSGGQ